MNGSPEDRGWVRVKYYVLGLLSAVGLAWAHSELVMRPQMNLITRQVEASMKAMEDREIAREKELLEEEERAAACENAERTPTAPPPRPAVRP